MTTLKANEAARVALAWRKLIQRAELVRGRVEAMPGAHMESVMASVEGKIALRQTQAVIDGLDRIDAALAAYSATLEQTEQARAAAEQDALMRMRGVETVAIGNGRSRDGWQWLVSKRRLTDAQVWAGERYSNLFSLAHRDGLSSSANDVPANDSTEDPIEARHKARQELDRVRRHIIGAAGHDRLVALLDSVCGRGETVRSLAANDDRKAGGYEVELRLALDMAGVAFKGGRREEAA